jgi:hypothetical protein
MLEVIQKSLFIRRVRDFCSSGCKTSTSSCYKSEMCVLIRAYGLLNHPVQEVTSDAIF